MSNNYLYGTYYSIPIIIPTPEIEEDYLGWEKRLKAYVSYSIYSLIDRLEYESQVSSIYKKYMDLAMQEIKEELPDKPKLPDKNLNIVNVKE